MHKKATLRGSTFKVDKQITVARMVREAQDRLYDAGILASSINTRSDSQSFIRVLAFEVLLKAAVLASSDHSIYGHSYDKLWNNLPSHIRTSILDVATARMPDQADLSDIAKLLVSFQFIFEKARYSYEQYVHYTPQEMGQLGEYWDTLGAPVGEAIISYYPEELQCLIEGLLQYLAQRDKSGSA